MATQCSTDGRSFQRESAIVQGLTDGSGVTHKFLSLRPIRWAIRRGARTFEECDRNSGQHQMAGARQPDPSLPDALSPLCSLIADINATQIKLRTHQPPVTSPGTHTRKKCHSE